MKYQLVLQFPLSESSDFDALIEFETRLTFELGSEHVVDGHDLGSSEMNVFIHTDSPEIAFEKATLILGEHLSATIKAAYRAMDSDQYQWIHPANHEGEFRIP
jgi:hypothetical protein